MPRIPRFRLSISRWKAILISIFVTLENFSVVIRAIAMHNLPYRYFVP